SRRLRASFAAFLCAKECFAANYVLSGPLGSLVSVFLSVADSVRPGGCANRGQEFPRLLECSCVPANSQMAFLAGLPSMLLSRRVRTLLPCVDGSPKAVSPECTDVEHGLAVGVRVRAAGFRLGNSVRSDYASQ